MAFADDTVKGVIKLLIHPPKNNESIEPKPYLKYLGVLIGNNLKVTENVQYLIEKLNKFISSFNRLKNLLNFSQLLFYYDVYNRLFNMRCF